MNDKSSLRLARLVAIHIHLQSGCLVTAPQLAASFGVSSRTIYRDVRMLEQAGVPIATDEGKGYSLVAGYRLPPIMFTENEANALVTAERLVAASKDASLVQEFVGALRKIKAVLPARHQRNAAALESRTLTSKGFHAAPTSNLLLQLQRALLDHQVVRLVYEAPGQAATARAVEPFVFYLTDEQEWVMAAFCRLRDDFRTFRLDRIRQAAVLDEHFAPHALTIAQYVQKYVRAAPHP